MSDEEERRSDAYHNTKGDVEAAEVLGMPVTTFRSWRASRGMPSKRPRNSANLRILEPSAEVRLWAYKITDSVNEAARFLDIDAGTLGLWYRKRGLKSKDTPKEESRRRDAYESTDTDAEAAEMLGIKKSTFTSWRQYYGLPPKKESGWSGPYSYNKGNACMCGKRISDQNKEGLCSGHRMVLYFTLVRMRSNAFSLAMSSPNEIREVLNQMRDEDPDIYNRWFADIEPQDEPPDWWVAAAKKVEIIPPQGMSHGRVSKEEVERRMKAYDEYDGDREAADALGMKKSSFVSWRLKRRLPVRWKVNKPL